MIQNESDRQAGIDSEHLRLLSIFHFVAAGFAFLGLAFSAVYFAFFQWVMSNPKMWEKSSQGPPPEMFIGLFRVLFVAFVLWFLISALGNLMSGIYMRKFRNRTFSMVVAGINCLHIPLGTILGIMTFIVITRDSVRRRYELEP